ncbi:hypothetical protein FAZ69_28030 [Trinickia terrae]|uniref:Uncharacterized protein n=1 Tax=Trinickia terrae TaxID=2571161 RepID=A0A4U1HJX7_9BURK|nr:hypothetical protein [Trinickia terrae]TKC81471.1 hypothetical protein FAZ69_28030 [Trinickia terrae]
MVTRLTLRVHELPETFGAVNFSVKAASEDAFHRLIGLTMDFYAKHLLNPHWGEQIRLQRDNALHVQMVFQGFGRAQAKAIWQPFLDTLAQAPDDFKVDASPLSFLATPARTFWEPTAVKRLLGLMHADDRPGAPKDNVFWTGDQSDAGAVWHGYQSAWLPANLLQDDRRQALVDALRNTTRRGCSSSITASAASAGAPTASRGWTDRYTWARSGPGQREMRENRGIRATGVRSCAAGLPTRETRFSSKPCCSGRSIR